MRFYRRPWSPGPLAFAVIGAAGFGRPLTLWYINRSQGLQPIEVLAIGMAVTASGSVLLWIFARNGRRDLTRVAIVIAVAIVCFYHWMPERGGSGPLANVITRTMVLLGLIGAAGFLTRFLSVRIFVGFVIASMVVLPAAQLLAWSFRGGRVVLPAATAPRIVSAGPSAPDIFVVVVDGYARADVLRSLYGFDNGDFLEDLSREGFQVSEDARANYSMTYASIPSLLLMDYPVRDGDPVDERTHEALNAASGGDNPVVASLRAAGYEYVHVESGIGQTRCGAQVDRCIRAPLLDESAWGLLARTPARLLLGSDWGYFTSGALNALEELIELAQQERDRPRLVVAHVLLPHPPLLLDEACATRTTGGRHDDVVLGTPHRTNLDELRMAYIDQVRCTNELLLRFSRSLDRGAFALIVSDHGSDLLEQLWTDIDDWSDRQLIERFSILSAVRVGDCGMEPPQSTVNIMRYVLHCAHGSPLSYLSDVYRIVPRPLSNGERTLTVSVPSEVPGT